MTARAVATMLLLAASVASAESLTGSLGAGYSTEVVRDADVDPLARHMLLLQAELGMAGDLLHEGYLSYQLAGSYSNLRTTSPESRLRLDDLGYSATISALRNSAAPLALFASRTTTDSTTTRASAEFLGSGVVDTVGGSITTAAPGTPRASLQVIRTDSTIENTLGDAVHHEQLTGTLRARQDLERLSYDLYAVRESSQGSLPGADSTSTFLTLTQQAELTERLRFAGNAALFRREAGGVELGSPDYWNENASLRVIAEHRPDLRSEHTYAYDHFRRTDATNDVDEGAHVLSSRLQLTRPQGWTASGGVDVSRQLVTVDGRAASSWAESFTGGAGVRRDLDGWVGQADATAFFGAVQPDEGEQGVSYGGTGALGGATTLAPGSSLSLGASAGFGTDTSEVGSTSYQLQGTLAAASTMLGPSRARLTAAASRQVRDSRLVGRSSATILSAQADALWAQRVTTLVRAQYQEGASVLARDPLEPLPVLESENVVSQTVTAQLGWEVMGNLSLDSSYSYSRVMASGPRQERQVASVRLAYQIGALAVTLQDQLVHDRRGDAGRFSNLLYLLVTRSFGVVL